MVQNRVLASSPYIQRSYACRLHNRTERFSLETTTRKGFTSCRLHNRQGFSHRHADAKSLTDKAFRIATTDKAFRIATPMLKAFWTRRFGAGWGERGAAWARGGLCECVLGD